MPRRIYFLIGTISILLSDIAANAAVTFSKPSKGLLFTDPDRFRAIGDNYAAYQWTENTDWVDQREGDLQGHFSLGYSFKRTTHTDVLFTYTGEFDFYVFDRNSGPVVNRLNNPALHYVRLPTFSENNKNKLTPILDFGLEHESDGQVQEVATTAEATLAQANYDSGNRPFFDQISRGSNFFSVSGRIPEGGDWFLPPIMSLQATARIYLTQDYDVTWGPHANEVSKLSDYNLLRLRAGLHKWGRWELQWTVGKSGFKHDSFDVLWQIDSSGDANKLVIPLFIKYHHGPLNILSNYTQPQDSISIGWRFSSFADQDKKLFQRN